MSTLKMTTRKIFMFLVTVLLFGCSSNNSQRARNIFVTFTQTLQNEDMYLLIIKADSILASQTASQDSIKEKVKTIQNDTTLSLVERLAKQDEGKDNNEIEKYKKEHPLFGVLYPNLTLQSNGEYTLTQSSFIGYSTIKDTSIVNKYLSSPCIKNLFQQDVIFKWVKSKILSDSYNLTALITSSKSLNLDTSGIENITIEKFGVFKESVTFKAAGAIFGKTEYVVILKLNQNAFKKVSEILDNKSAALVTVSLNDKEYTSSLTLDNLSRGIAIGEDINQMTVDSIKTNFRRLIKEQ